MGRIRYVKKGKEKFVYYLLWEEMNLIKIGVGSLLRIQNLRSILPFETVLVEKIKCKTLSEAYSLEKKLHKQYEARQFKNEWFKYPLENNTPDSSHR